MVDLSIIFPAYNESKRIGKTIKSFNEFISNKDLSYEFIIVDDGSTDNTSEFLNSLHDKIPNLRVITMPQNKGKGAAVREGMLAANGEIRLFSDADGSTPIEELDKLLTPLISQDCDIAIGSRYLDNSNIAKKQPFYRRVWSRLANRIIQKTLLPGIVDPHCGFKAFKSEAAIAIFNESKVNEWSFDLEVLALAKSMKYKVAEIPVKWAHDEQSKGKLSHLPKEILNVYRIKKRIAKLYQQ